MSHTPEQLREGLARRQARFQCAACGIRWDVAATEPFPTACPACGHPDMLATLVPGESES